MTGLGDNCQYGSHFWRAVPAGVLLKSGIPKTIQDTITKAVGLCVMFVGFPSSQRHVLFIENGELVTRIPW